MRRLNPLLTSTPAVSLLGKLPAALDFVRVNHDRPEAIEIDRWLQASLQRLTVRAQVWPSDCLRFLSVAQSGHRRTALLGVVSPSRDRAGRAFPLVVYTCVGSDTLGTFAAALPLAAERFGRDAQQLLDETRQLPVSQLQAALRRVRGPRPDELSDARSELQEHLTQGTLEAFTKRVFEDIPLAMAHEAFQRVLHASPTGPQAHDCYDCPVLKTLDVAIWSRLLELSQAPTWSCVWNVTNPGEARPRALVACAKLPERAPLFWATPAAKHPQLCRLERGAVNVHGRLSYAPLSGSETLAALFERLVRDASRD